MPMRGMLIAALTSRSCSEPQLPQIQVRTDNGISSTFGAACGARLGRGRETMRADEVLARALGLVGDLRYEAVQCENS
jgi:hypothetical protein